jgi:hypothetical protein
MGEVEEPKLSLSYHRQWLGKGKWLLRALQAFDPKQAERLTVALASFYQDGIKDDIVTFALDALALVGGRLFEGYASGKSSEEIQ